MARFNLFATFTQDRPELPVLPPVVPPPLEPVEDGTAEEEVTETGTAEDELGEDACWLTAALFSTAGAGVFSVVLLPAHMSSE